MDLARHKTLRVEIGGVLLEHLEARAAAWGLELDEAVNAMLAKGLGTMGRVEKDAFVRESVSFVADRWAMKELELLADAEGLRADEYLEQLLLGHLYAKGHGLARPDADRSPQDGGEEVPHD